jgi:ComF family protein
MGLLQRRVDDFLDLLYPPVCGLCGHPADSDDRLICNRCWELIEGPEAPYCSGCRQLLQDRLKCPACYPAPMIVFSLGYYDGLLQTILHDLKFKSLKPLANNIGRRLAERIAPYLDRLKLDLIVPVPLHDSRWYGRGFNQSEEIAVGMGKILGVPVLSDVLYAARKTKQQARLPASLREANVRGAYAVDDPSAVLAGKKILLVDDVTTGATLRENERVLLRASAAKIVAAVAATAL